MVLPEMIIIGIPNPNRNRDLTPGSEATGGGEKYIAFIEKELIPHLDSLYPTAPYRILIGHSLGGLMVVNTLIHSPYWFTSFNDHEDE